MYRVVRRSVGFVDAVRQYDAACNSDESLIASPSWHGSSPLVQLRDNQRIVEQLMGTQPGDQ
eukprot:6843029-Alexandrium_andersonii.AAC.1